MKAAIFLPNWVGDAVMATPVLRALRSHLGRDAKIVGLLRPNLAGLLSGTGWLDEEWYFRPGAAEPDHRAWSIVWRMRRERFDLCLLLPNSLRPALIAWLAGAKQRIGYVRNGRGPLLTMRLYQPGRPGRSNSRPVVDSYLQLVRVLGCVEPSRRLELATSAGSEQGLHSARPAHDLQ